MFALKRASYRCLTSKRLPKCYSTPSSPTSSSPSPVTVEKRDGVTLIAINRPDRRNCVNIETGQQLLSAFQRFDSDADSPVAVLHGNGGTFCAGFDLQQLAQFNTDTTAADLDSWDFRAPMGPSHMLTSKPVIAAIDGYAVAGGLELALLCDLRVMEENAVMGVFCRRFGVPLIDGGTVRLAKLIGLSRALDLILTGRPIGAKEALEFGLANRVAAVGCGLGQAYKLAHSLLKFPQECLRADRRSAYYAAYDAKSLEDALRFEYENGREIIAKEAIKGASRFTSDKVGRHGTFSLDKVDTEVDVTI